MRTGNLVSIGGIAVEMDVTVQSVLLCQRRRHDGSQTAEGIVGSRSCFRFITREGLVVDVRQKDISRQLMILLMKLNEPMKYR